MGRHTRRIASACAINVPARVVWTDTNVRTTHVLAIFAYCYRARVCVSVSVSVCAWNEMIIVWVCLGLRARGERNNRASTSVLWRVRWHTLVHNCVCVTMRTTTTRRPMATTMAIRPSIARKHIVYTHTLHIMEKWETNEVVRSVVDHMRLGSPMTWWHAPRARIHVFGQYQHTMEHMQHAFDHGTERHRSRNIWYVIPWFSAQCLKLQHIITRFSSSETYAPNATRCN